MSRSVTCHHIPSNQHLLTICYGCNIEHQFMSHCKTISMSRLFKNRHLKIDILTETVTCYRTYVIYAAYSHININYDHDCE